MKKNIRKAGVLLHPTSLPTKYGVGTIGKSAYDFVDKLYKAHVTLWQILPLGPSGFGDSPYAARSTFAGNEILIDLSKFMYVKADIAPKDIKISEIDNDNIVLNKTDNKFMQKLMLLAMTIIILITTISQFK